MALAEKTRPVGRHVLHLPNAETFSDHLGDFGEMEWPSPVEDPDWEAWGLRRFILALRREGLLRFPVYARAGLPEVAEPDFILSLADRPLIGIAFADVNARLWQAAPSRPARVAGVREAGGTDAEAVRDAIARGIAEAVRRAEERARDGLYRGVARVDLLVTCRQPGAGLEDVRAMLPLLRQGSHPEAGIEAVHVVVNETVVLDALRGDAQPIDLSLEYDIDLYAWSLDQAAKARAGEVTALDLANIAEELESMAKRDLRGRNAQMDRLLMHLLKWAYQPERRGKSWERSIRNAREKIAEAGGMSRSLHPLNLTGTDRDKYLVTAYRRAANKAAFETGLPEKTFPPDCPFTLEEILDPEFLPDGEPK